MIREASEAASEQEKMLQTLTSELQNSNRELKEAKKQHMQSLSRNGAELRQIQEKAEQYKLKIADLETQKLALQRKVANSSCEKLKNSKPDDFEANRLQIVADFENVVSDLEEQKKQSKQKIVQLEAERDELRAELEKHKVRVQALEQEMHTFKKAGHILAQDVVDFSTGLMESAALDEVFTSNPTSDGDN